MGFRPVLKNEPFNRYLEKIIATLVKLRRLSLILIIIEDESAERDACPYPLQYEKSNHHTEVHLESAKDESWGGEKKHKDMKANTCDHEHTCMFSHSDCYISVINCLKSNSD